MQDPNATVAVHDHYDYLPTYLPRYGGRPPSHVTVVKSGAVFADAKYEFSSTRPPASFPHQLQNGRDELASTAIAALLARGDADMFRAHITTFEGQCDTSDPSEVDSLSTNLHQFPVFLSLILVWTRDMTWLRCGCDEHAAGYLAFAWPWSGLGDCHRAFLILP